MTVTATAAKRAPATAALHTAQPSTALGCIVAVSPSGRLRLPAAPRTASAVASNRRTHTGTAYRIDVDGGISCWLDGDQHDGSGELNPVATGMCTALSDGTFTGPHDTPFVCGLVLFTGTTASGPAALSDEQVRRVVDAHAAASDEPGDPAGADLALAEVAQPQLAAA